MGLRNRTKLTDHRCFFVTITCHEHHFFLPDEVSFTILYENIRFYNQKYSTRLVAYVFMSNHIHLIVYFEQENRLSDYVRDFKKMTSRTLRD
ncbi:transposase [Fibrella sp. USSR17]